MAVAPDRRVKINVGGKLHETMPATLLKVPNTRLANLMLCKTRNEILHLCDGYDVAKNEFYFNRDPSCFGSILNLYRLEELHVNESDCVNLYSEELLFWGIDEEYISPCCQGRYYDMISNRRINFKVFKPFVESGLLSNLKLFLWSVFKSSSLSSKVFSAISLSFTLLSVSCIVIETLPHFKADHFGMTQFNKTTQILKRDHSVFDYIEITCTVWFLLEFIARFYSYPKRKDFMKSILNMIDLAAIFPYLLCTIVIEIIHFHHLPSITLVQKIVQAFQIMRIFRIFKLFRHFIGLQSLGSTLIHSSKELSVLMLFISFSVLLFGSIIYLAESGSSKSEFTSIPKSFWWVTISITTVGYGDMIPNTLLGKLIGSICCVFGVLIVALPVPIIVNNFAQDYKMNSMQERVMKKCDIDRATKTVTDEFVNYNMLQFRKISGRPDSGRSYVKSFDSRLHFEPSLTKCKRHKT